jgi:hypothetical protein
MPGPEDFTKLAVKGVPPNPTQYSDFMSVQRSKFEN